MSRKGFTLLEVIVGAGLMALVISLCMLLLLPTLRASARGMVHAEMEDQALLVASLLGRDLDGAVPQGVSLSTDGQTLAIMPIQDLLDSRLLAWLPQFAVYHWDSASATVVRRVWYSPGPPDLGLGTLDGSHPIRLSDAQMAALSGSTSLESRVLASGVTAFAITQNGPGPSVTDPVTMSVTLQRHAATGRELPESFTLTRGLSFRNHQ